MKICAATGNPGKLRELRRILEAQGHQVLSQKELGLDLEPGGDRVPTGLQENAAIKAAALCKASGLPTIADDSGLCVDALDGRPAYTAPATAAATATMKPTTINCCRRWPLCRKVSARRSLFPPFA